MNLKFIAVVGLGGALGAIARYLMVSGVNNFWKADFPLSTFLVNMLGSFVIGALTEFMLQHEDFNLTWRLFLVTGILGGFTTFSAFSLDTGFLLQKGEFFSAALYVCGSVFVSLAAFFVGMAIFR